MSALVLNFVPEREKALAEMKRVTRAGGRVAFYVWDYPGGGVEFMRAFWKAAAALDPNARDLTEDRRFPYCTPDGLADLARRAGLASVECNPIEVATEFKDFEDYWRPFTLGAGPAPGYCASLDPAARQRLKEKLAGPASPRGRIDPPEGKSMGDQGAGRLMSGLSGILCARPVSSLADEPFAEDDGELRLGLEPLARRSFPFLGRVVQDQI